MWGIIPAAGRGSRIQPLAFSKELLPVGSRMDGATERPRAISEYLVERMLLAGADKLCFVISPGKSDILEYYGSSVQGAAACYVVQETPGGLCDALFRTCPFITPDEHVLVGLPDTLWFPEGGLAALPVDRLSFLLFPVEHPEYFDEVITDPDGTVTEIRVKQPGAGPGWVWGAFRMPGKILHELHGLWNDCGRKDEYIGSLVNTWIERGGAASGIRAGFSYVDVGTINGYREALALLASRPDSGSKQDETEGPVSDRDSLNDRYTGKSARVPEEAWTVERIRERVRELGNWFHNMDLGGVRTAPDHFLGDYPSVKWSRFAHAVPEDLRGMSVLDIGCNAGFYSIEMKKRGASRVVAVDWDEDYLAQGRFAAEVSGFPDIEFRKLSVYDIAELGERFDLVLFMGVFYHLRHPLLALDLLHEHVTKDLLVFQSMQRGNSSVLHLEDDYPFSETAIFESPGYPKLHFVEHRYSGDITNWWIPNRACTEALLRSAGFRPLSHPEEEVYVCRHVELTPDIAGPRAIYPAWRNRIHG